MWMTDFNGESGISGTNIPPLFHTEQLCIHSSRPNFIFHRMGLTVIDIQCSDHILFSCPHCPSSFSRKDLVGWSQGESVQQPEPKKRKALSTTQVNKKGNGASPAHLPEVTHFLAMATSFRDRKGRKYAAKRASVECRSSVKLYSW